VFNLLPRFYTQHYFNHEVKDRKKRKKKVLNFFPQY